MKRIITSLAVAFSLTLPSAAQFSQYDVNEPFGWCTCKSYTTAGYNITGGEGSTSKKTITLTSTGQDQSDAIKNAIKNNDIIIFDGSKGDFLFKQRISLTVSNKTIVGINNARFCTMFFVTPEIKTLLDQAGVKSASTSSGTGGTLPNGKKVEEQREYLTRLTLINAGYDDSQVQGSGILSSLSSCSNIIIRNLKFVGPGPIDVGGCDLLTISNGNNIWVDHCEFTDGIDGNFDINNGANLITVSWCTFAYTDRAYDHMNSNLIGGSDSQAAGQNKHNVTYANCLWGYKCNQRMPMARNGIIHLINDYYNCAGNSVAINPRAGSKFVVEGISVAKNVSLFSQSGSVSCSFSNGYYENGFNEKSSSYNYGTKATIPYSYTVYDAKEVAEEVRNYAGATLTDPLKIGKEHTGIVIPYRPIEERNRPQYNLSGTRISNSHKGIVIQGNKKFIKR